MLHHYNADAADPAWMVRAGQFHGHLGPWLVLGMRAGQDALQRLATRGYWDVDVTVWLAPANQRQPWTCILDGLQVSTGATLGKQNIAMTSPPGTAPDGRPVVHVVRRAKPDQPPQGVAYTVSEGLWRELAAMTPDKLEALSRDLAGRQLATLFEIRTLTPAEAAALSKPPAQNH